MVRRSRLQRQQVSGKDFLRWIHSKPVYDRWFTSQKGFTLGADRRLAEPPGSEVRSGASSERNGESLTTGRKA
jgi:hypothetical protein